MEGNEIKLSSTINNSLTFKNISCSVNVFLPRKLRIEKKQILRDVHGSFKSGELSAIMGPSGAGKTTLLNILAGFSTKGASGEIFINNTLISASNPTRLSSLRYICQDHNLREHLTVSETMSFVAALKLGDLNTRTRMNKVDGIISDLGLSKSYHTTCRNLSGGEKKRLSVAVELLSDPQILFLDEPTTGLDISMASSVISLLRTLAQSDKIIIMTIHQPSALLMEKIDSLYCLSAGRTFYTGPCANLLPALNAAGLECPTYHNCADFFIEVASGEHNVDLEKISEEMQRFNKINSVHDNTEYTNFQGQDNCSHLPKKCHKTHRLAGNIRQINLLINRSILTLARNYNHQVLRIVAHIFCAYLMGEVYVNSGATANGTISNLVYIFAHNLSIAATSLMSGVLSVVHERSAIQSEYFNKWYNFFPYVTAFLIVDVTFQMILCIISIFISYWLTGNPIDLFRMGLFTVSSVLGSLSGQAWGYFFGTITRQKIAVMLGPVSLSTFSIFGFNLRLNDVPYMLRWIYHMSYFRAAYHNCGISIYGFNREKLPCLEVVHERSAIQSEYFNKWYNFFPYVTAFLIVDVTFQMILCIISIFISYWLTGNPIDLFRMGLFTVSSVLGSLSGQAWGYFFGTITRQKIAVMLGPVSLSTFSIFGFNLRLNDVPYMLRWIYHMSYFRAAYHNCGISIYGFNREKLPCLEVVHERSAIQSEYFNKWYNFFPYVTAFLIVDVTFQMILCIISIFISYWLTGNPIDLFRMGLFTVSSVLGSLSGQAWGYFFGTITRQKIAVMLGPISLSTFSIFGFNLRLNDVPYMLRWIYHMSYFRAAYHNCGISIYGFNREKLPCLEEFCYFSKPIIFLNENEVYEDHIYLNMVALLSTIVILYFCTFFVVWYRLNKR